MKTDATAQNSDLNFQLERGPRLLVTDDADSATISQNFQKSPCRTDSTEQLNAKDNKGLKLVSNTPSLAPQSLKPQLKNYVNGNVLDLVDSSVLCEVESDKGMQRVMMPLALFPPNIFVGYSFQISLDSSSGFKTPIIQSRKTSAPENVIREIDKLVESILS